MRWHHQELIGLAIHSGFNPSVFDLLQSGKQVVLRFVGAADAGEVNHIYAVGAFGDTRRFDLRSRAHGYTSEVKRARVHAHILHKLGLAGTAVKISHPVNSPVIWRFLYGINDRVLKGKGFFHTYKVFALVQVGPSRHIRGVIPGAVHPSIVLHYIKREAALHDRIVRLGEECYITHVLEPAGEDLEHRLLLLGLRQYETHLVMEFVLCVTSFELETELFAKLL